uniref:Growth factor receptor bound protein 7 n=1 Tax=Coturnix japonica TaxID=93934 RepID=A0A8C2SUE7_COTJA
MAPTVGSHPTRGRGGAGDDTPPSYIPPTPCLASGSPHRIVGSSPSPSGPKLRRSHPRGGGQRGAVVVGPRPPRCGDVRRGRALAQVDKAGEEQECPVGPAGGRQEAARAADDAMDGGAQQSCIRDPPGVGSVEQEGDVGEGPPATDLRRSQPLFIHSSSRPLSEEEPRASSLPNIPNPFPELCSPSNSPILNSPPGGQGPPREGACHSLFPEVMVSSCLEANKSMAHSELIQNFLNSGSCPEVQGFLQLREASRKVWKRFYFSLRRSGLYYSTKGTSKDPRHLQYFADLTESNIYYVTQGKKHYGTPTEFGFCIKPYKVRSGVKGLKLLCSEDEQSRTCWMAAFRLFKYGMQLYRNYQQAQARLSQHPWITPTPLQSVSDSALVAMDFSGCTGRVIENPSEVLTAVLEEAQAWRKKTTHRYSLPAACQSSPLSAAIHRTQPWFHGRISREDTQQLIGRQGLVDGVFLVRESQRNPKGFVLSLCHLQKVKHYLILPVSIMAVGGIWGGGGTAGPDAHLSGRVRRKGGSTSPWTTDRPALLTSSSSWSSTRSTVASCPASCGTTAPAWPYEPGAAGTAQHSSAWHHALLP